MNHERLAPPPSCKLNKYELYLFKDYSVENEKQSALKKWFLSRNLMINYYLNLIASNLNFIFMLLYNNLLPIFNFCLIDYMVNSGIFAWISLKKTKSTYRLMLLVLVFYFCSVLENNIYYVLK